jgi:hypothetical protein
MTLERGGSEESLFFDDGIVARVVGIDGWIREGCTDGSVAIKNLINF